MKKVALLIPALLLLSACQGTNNSTEPTDTATPETHSTSQSSSKETDTQSTTKKSEALRCLEIQRKRRLHNQKQLHRINKHKPHLKN